VDSLESLFNLIDNKKCTLLGIGPMSKNCVDVVIDLANDYDIPIMMIASRRQIESKELGSGYVNNWSTEEFSKYITKKDKKKNIILCRDHGGPYQNENEVKQNLPFEEIMENTKKSFRVDIESGFKIIHIDPSNNLSSKISLDEMLNRIFELYEFCYDISKKTQNEIFIEISIGKEDGGLSEISEIKYAISKIEEFCQNKNVPLPLFFVIKTGNHVMETQNVGIFEDVINNKKTDTELKLKEIIEFCNQKKIMVKIHNGDYLSELALSLHPQMGFHAMNIAPEFGTIETRSILSWLSENNLQKFEEEFLDIAYKSKKWQKWMLANSNLTKKEKSIIAGHYILSTNEFIDFKKKILGQINNKNDFDNFIKKNIKNSILKYLRCLNLINNSVNRIE
jgi:hypothetical protein